MYEVPTNADPDPPPPGNGPEVDGTLGGYFRHHNRPPAFQGLDGNPYTVSVEVERGPDLDAPFLGYLVFPRWAQTGAGIIGHLETPIILRGRSQEEVQSALDELTLPQVRTLLDEALARRRDEI